MRPVLDPATDPAIRLAIRDVAPLPGFLDAARAVVSHLRASSGLSLWLVTRTAGDDWVVLAASEHESGADLGVCGGDVLTWSDSLCARMVSGQGPRVAPVVGAVAAYATAPVRAQHRIGAYVGVPLVGPDGELFGTLCGIDPDPASAALHEVLPIAQLQAQLLSALLAVEMSATRAARSAALKRLGGSHRVLDGRAWEGLLEDEERRCAPLAVPGSVVALEALGLPRDRLAVVVRALLDRARPGDALARTGPSSYAVLLSETPAVVAEVMASELVLRLQELGVTATCGVAARGGGANLRRAWRRAEGARRRDAGPAPLLVAVAG